MSRWSLSSIVCWEYFCRWIRQQRRHSHKYLLNFSMADANFRQRGTHTETLPIPSPLDPTSNQFPKDSCHYPELQHNVVRTSVPCLCLYSDLTELTSIMRSVSIWFKRISDQCICSAVCLFVCCRWDIITAVCGEKKYGIQTSIRSWSWNSSRLIGFSLRKPLTLAEEKVVRWYWLLRRRSKSRETERKMKK